MPNYDLSPGHPNYDVDPDSVVPHIPLPPRWDDYTQRIHNAASPLTRLEELDLWRGCGAGVYLVVLSGAFEAGVGPARMAHQLRAGEVAQVCVEKRMWFTSKPRWTRTLYTKDGCFPTETSYEDNDDTDYSFPPSRKPQPFYREDRPVKPLVQYDWQEAISELDCNRMVNTFLCRFPTPNWELPEGCYQPHLECDVFVVPESNLVRLKSVQTALKTLSDTVGRCVVPKYLNVIDPNLFVHEGRWVASEWDISESGEATLLGGNDAHPHSSVVETVFTPILNAALPLLASLQRPALHLPGTRLQAVPKIQSIVVPPKGITLPGEDEQSKGGTYQGLWHSDGDVEDIAAVVLYYYDIEKGLEGGAMEFSAQDVMDMLGYADCDDNGMDFKKQNLQRWANNKENGNLPIFKVPCETGTLLVFSNYQLVHRVLQIVNTEPQEGKRSFAALFIVNPAGERLPSSQDVMKSTQYQEETDEKKEAVRVNKLRAQLEPKGSFGVDHSVYVTGNGCAMLIKWVKESVDKDCIGAFDYDGAGEVFASMTHPPGMVGRGVSEAISRSSAQSVSSGG